MERVLSSLGEQIELGDIGVCQEMICDIANGSVNWSSSARCHICKSGYTGHDTGKQHCYHSKHTQERLSNAIFQGNLNFIFFSVCVCINIECTLHRVWQRNPFFPDTPWCEPDVSAKPSSRSNVPSLSPSPHFILISPPFLEYNLHIPSSDDSNLNIPYSHSVQGLFDVIAVEYPNRQNRVRQDIWRYGSETP